MLCLMQNHYPRHDLMMECTKNSHDIRYEIMTEGMKKKKVKKNCGQSRPQMYLISNEFMTQNMILYIQCLSHHDRHEMVYHRHEKYDGP